MAEKQRRLAAILVTDVVGYSKLVGSDEAGTLARLQALRRDVIDPTIARHSGRLFKTVGDGFLVEFASAVQAVTAARAIQQANEGGVMPLRIGIHVGDVVVEGDDLMGDGVNIAARVEGVADTGGIAISRAVHEQVRDKLDVSFVDKGEVSLKNLARPVQVFALGGASPVAAVEAAPALTLPDKPSIAVLPFQNMSGDPEQEYFADGMVEDIITELSRFREFAVIARNSTFFYKNKPVDIAKVAGDLRVRYVLEGSVRKAGKRIRVTAQLIDAATNDHLWAERYDRKDVDVFDLQEEITRTVVASIAPQINLAEMARSRHEAANPTTRQLAWRASGLYWDALKAGDPLLLQQAIATCNAAIAADPRSLPAYDTLVALHWACHIYRWGEQPEGALDRAWAVVERMTEIDPRDARTLTTRGRIRAARGEYERGLADLRQALDVNPNMAQAVRALAFVQATLGLAREAAENARLALHLSPRDYGIGDAYLALAMAHFTLHDYGEAIRWCDAAIQYGHRVPIRRGLAIACSALSGDLARARAETATLSSFAPNFIASLFRGENPVFARREDMDHLLAGLRLAGLNG